jgi:hypothetical protein
MFCPSDFVKMPVAFIYAVPADVFVTVAVAFKIIFIYAYHSISIAVTPP